MKTNEEILNEYLEKPTDMPIFPQTKEVILQAMKESNKQLVTAINELMVFLLQHPEKEFFKKEEIPIPNFETTVNLLYSYLRIEEIEDMNKSMILTDHYCIKESERRTVMKMLYGLNLKR